MRGFTLGLYISGIGGGHLAFAPQDLSKRIAPGTALRNTFTLAWRNLVWAMSTAMATAFPITPTPTATTTASTTCGPHATEATCRPPPTPTAAPRWPARTARRSRGLTKLPAPFSTPSAFNFPRVVPKPADAKLSVPQGFKVDTFVAEGQFGDNDWYYVSRDTKAFAFRNPTVQKQTVVHVRFDSAGNVVSVEQTGKELVASIDPVNDKTPTLGRDKSLFEELFGNIGTLGAGPPGGGQPPQ